MTVKKLVTITAHLTAAEVVAILRQHFALQKAGGVIVPDGASFNIDKAGASFMWTETKES